MRIAIRTAMALAAMALGVVGVGAQETPGFGSGFGMHRPPMERALGAHGPMGRWWNNPSVVEKLKLTDDQRKAMDQILQEHRVKLIDLNANVEKAELTLSPLMQADQPNEGQILAAIDKVAQARAELEKANARFLLALRAKLSPEQWKQLQAMRSEHEWRHDHDRDMRDRRTPLPPGAGAPPQLPAPPPAGAGPQGALPDKPSPAAQPDFEARPEIGVAQ